jgi:hypothetical protein
MRRRKYFFFEKKKQKTFALLVAPLKPLARLREGERLPLNNQKFFDSFFQKRTTSFLLHGLAT